MSLRRRALAVLRVGWGIVLVVGQEVVAHLLNTLGWRFAFARDHAAALPFRVLLRLRLAGDAVNYLTPSATIAGEYARVAMLGDRLGADTRTASVLVAKFAQTLAQALFVVGSAGRGLSGEDSRSHAPGNMVGSDAAAGEVLQ